MTRALTLRVLVRVGAAALVVLLARTIAYAVEPSSAARLLEARAGGPALPVLALVSLSLGAALAVAICWLAAIAVREQALLERRGLAAPVHPFRIGQALALAVGLSVVTSVGGGLVEAYIHWRAGFGWHGVQCVFGPVHRDLLPIEAGLSLVAAALISAAQHVLAWMRRTFALLRAPAPRLWACAGSVRMTPLDRPRLPAGFGSAAARAPPLCS
jgi:hypothetical protein